MNRQWAVVGVFIGLIVVLIGSGWLVRDRFAPVEVGTRAPDFVAYDMSGEPVRLASLKGEVVLLNIWATWCPPCREEMPSMQRLHEKLGPEGLRIVAVSVDALPGRFDPGGNLGGDIEKFARSLGLTFAIWHDPDGKIQRTYRTTGVPESFLINRDGFITKKHTGPWEWDSPAIVESITRLLES